MPDNPFCFEGHQLPELFLLGVQKCGTTSLTKQLFTEWGFFGDAQAKGRGGAGRRAGTARGRRKPKPVRRRGFDDDDDDDDDDETEEDSDDEAARRKARKAKASKAKKGKGRKGAESLSMLRMEDDPVAGIPL